MKENQRSKNLISTKFNRPPVARDIYPVDRLLETIDESQKLPFFLISAPAGYGKSTLASRWLETCDNPNTWLSLDEQDNDIHTFLTYFLATVQSVFPRVGQETLELLKSVNLPPFPVFSQSIINTLNELNQDLIMVLDDYQFIRNKEVHELITKILIHPPNKLHLVLLTRRDPPFPISTLRGRGQMREITISELRFTFEETKEFFQKVLNMPVDQNTVNLLEEKIEGWVTSRTTGLTQWWRNPWNQDSAFPRNQPLQVNAKSVTY
jgi:LuxR family maltose regulon positive regulatory protein